MKKVFTLIIITILTGCRDKHTELTIIEKKSPIKKNYSSVNNNEKRKDLIHITKNDILKILVKADGGQGMHLDNTGKSVGFYVELEKKIMEEMDQKHEFVPYDNLASAVHKIKTGECHSALSTPDVTDYRTLVNLSIPYEELFYSIFINLDNNIEVPKTREAALRSLSGKRVGTQVTGSIYQVLREYREIEIVTYPTRTVALEALHNNEVDAVLAIERIAKFYKRTKGYRIKPVGEPVISFKMGTGFSKRLDKTIVDRYNRALEKLINQGYIEQLYKKYYGG